MNTKAHTIEQRLKGLKKRVTCLDRKAGTMTNDEFSRLRKYLGYSQTDLARIMYKSRATISRWENCEKPISPLAALCIGTLLPKKKQEAPDADQPE